MNALKEEVKAKEEKVIREGKVFVEMLDAMSHYGELCEKAKSNQDAFNVQIGRATQDAKDRAAQTLADAKLQAEKDRAVTMRQADKDAASTRLEAERLLAKAKLKATQLVD